MKRFVALLPFVFLATPGVALAQDQPAVAPPAPPGAHAPLTPQQRQALSSAAQQLRAQSKALMLQTRAQVLSSLSPAHRAMLANIAGQLAIAPNPNLQAAARQLDAALSPGERNAVLSAHANLVSQMRAMHQQMWAQLQSELPNMPRRSGPPPGAGFGPSRSHPAPDAGSILLRMASGHEMEHGFGSRPMMMGPPREAPQP